MRLSILLISFCLLGGCQSLKEQNKQDFANIENWKGQNIQTAIDALGQPERVTTGPKGHAYFWYRAREVNKTVVGNPYPANGTGLANPHAPYVTHQASCHLRITTTPDNIIMHYRYKGSQLGCQVLAKELHAAVQAGDDDEPDAEDSSKDGNAGK